MKLEAVLEDAHVCEIFLRKVRIFVLADVFRLYPSPSHGSDVDLVAELLKALIA